MNANTKNKVIRYEGTDLNTKGWQQEAVLRMLMNNLDPEVAERPEDLVVYGGIGKRLVTGSALMQLSNH